jgi:hypothetical protein
MTVFRKAIDTILITSVGGWLLVLLAILLPTTGLIMENPSGIIGHSILNAFLLLGSVASITCFISGSEMFRASKPILEKLPATIEPEQDRNDLIFKAVDEQAQNPENLKQPIGAFETEKLGLPEHKDLIAWRREEYWVKGKLRVAYREIESGQYIKSPLGRPKIAKRKTQVRTSIQSKRRAR